MVFPHVFFIFPKNPPFFPVFSFMSNSYKSAGLFICFIHFPYKYKKFRPCPLSGPSMLFSADIYPFFSLSVPDAAGTAFCIGKDTAGFSHKYPYAFRIIWQFSLQIPSVFIIIPHSCPNPIRKSYWIHSDISTMISHRREDKGSALLPPCIRMLTNSYLLSMRQEVLS